MVKFFPQSTEVMHQIPGRTRGTWNNVSTISAKQAAKLKTAYDRAGAVHGRDYRFRPL